MKAVIKNEMLEITHNDGETELVSATELLDFMPVDLSHTWSPDNGMDYPEVDVWAEVEGNEMEYAKMWVEAASV